MAIPSIKQVVENCPHGCGASINDAKKSGKGRIRYHRCNRCKKTYSVRYELKKITH